MLQFEPLIRFWTLRFESKHAYFKDRVRKCKNYKNLTKTVSERHQLLQAYINTGDRSSVCQIENFMLFEKELYSTEIVQAVKNYFNGETINFTIK